MWLTDPLDVSCVTSLSTTSGANWRITAKDSFFKLIGRPKGTTDLSDSESNVNSSESKRQLRLVKPAHKVLFPEPGGAGRITARPPLSSTAACKVSTWWACVEMHQFMAHSSKGNAWSSGSGTKGFAPS